MDMLRKFLLPALSLVVGSTLFSQDPARKNDPSDHVIRTQADAVVLDIVVRDRKGRAVRDLRPEEMRIFEDDVEQELLTFRSREEIISGEAEGKESSETAPDKPAFQPRPAKIDPFRHVNLVSLVFDRLSIEGRRFAHQGALDFLEAGIVENTLVAVFIIEHRLHVLQQFTRDPALIRSALEKATSGEYARFVSESEAMQLALQQQSSAAAAASSSAASVGRGNPPSGDLGADSADQALAEMTLNMLERSEELMREQQGIASIYALLALVGEQGRLAGRKTVLYFSEGLHAPPNLVDRLHYTIGEANKANVSIYAVDARGLNSSGQMTATNEMLGRASGATQNQLLFGVGRAVTREQVMAMENAEASLRLNLQGTLADLAESTGGFLIANTNDIRPSVRKLKEDLQIYYEVAYMPKNLVYNGQFRQIRVEVSRPEVTVQARTGYFAVPPRTDGPPIFPYEVPLLAALSSQPLPSEFDFRSRALRFRRSANGYHYSLVMEVPLSHFTFQEDRENKTYKTRFSLMALVKEPSGKVVHKVSQDYPLEGPLEKLPEMKAADILFIRQFHLAPGRYRLEVAAFDNESGRQSARRQFLLVPKLHSGVALSGLSLIRRIDPVEAERAGTHNPFVVESGKIVPDLTAAVQKDAGTVSVFMVVYPSEESESKPSLILQLIKDGETVGQAPLDLPAPGGEGNIPYIATLPVNELMPGRYEIRAIAEQGGFTAVEHGFFTLLEENQ